MTAVPGTRVDPRLRARRIAVQREQGRRRLRVLLAVAGVVALASLAYAAVHSSLVDVDRVVVAGAGRSGGSVVRESAGVAIGEPLLLVDTGAVARRVEELPWVVEARVGRVLPGVLEIEVVEQQPTAFVRLADGDLALVGRDGAVLDEIPADDAAEGVELAGLVELIGLRTPPEVGGLVSPPGVGEVAASLPSPLAESVTGIDLGGRDVALLLATGGEVRLGDLSDLPAKAAAAQAVLDRLAGRAFAYVDVSVPSAPVVGSA